MLTEKTSWFITGLSNGGEYPCLGECSIIPGLSPDPITGYEARLAEVCRWLNGEQPDAPDLEKFPSIRFGTETFLEDRRAGGTKIFSESPFTTGNAGMQVNGLIWMGSRDEMRARIVEKLDLGFRCLKMKIGAIDFEEELDLLRFIRKEYGSEPELRVDANGAFQVEEAGEKLERLSAFDIHSIEQPIKAGQWEAMAKLCSDSPVDIALDEELIGINDRAGKAALLEAINPKYVVLKPSLTGGMAATDEWIEESRSRGIGWWITSALESNIGLNAIAQYTFNKIVSLPQGLGTGSLFTNNFDSPLYLQGDVILFDPQQIWNLKHLYND